MKKTTFPSYTCAHCREQFQFENIRYSNNGKRILCLDCYNRLLKSDKQKKDTEVTAPKEEKLVGKDRKDGIKVICVDCRYKFFLAKKPNMKFVCPYCGKDKLIEDATTAEKLVEEASRMLQNRSRF